MLVLTLEEGVHAGVSGLDLGEGEVGPVHSVDEGRLDLRGGDDALAVPEHGVAERRKRRRGVQERLAHHPFGITALERPRLELREHRGGAGELGAGGVGLGRWVIRRDWLVG